jgi:hypothetical protein
MMELTCKKSGYNKMMKSLFIGLFLSSSLFASGYGKPQLLARYSGTDSYNIPLGLTCFTSDPLPTFDGVFLRCMNNQGQSQMVRFQPRFELVAISENGLFSLPKEVDRRSSWYEFDEAGLSKLFEFRDSYLHVTKLKNLGPQDALIDAFIPIKNDFYIYRLQRETKQLFTWKDGIITTFFDKQISHLFPPETTANGNFVFKIRKDSLSENAPDELIFWDGDFKSVLKDQDADPASAIKSFRHQFALDHESIAVIATDNAGEALFIMKKGVLVEVARVGKDLSSFDFFSPKMKNGILVFRGIDLEKRKALWVFENKVLKKLLTQGDVVKTDVGLARFDYKSQDALFYGAPGISESGDIYQQATLTDIDFPMTLLGVGLIKFNKE